MKTKWFFLISILLIFTFSNVSASDTLRYYTPNTPSVYYDTYPTQIARFELPQPAAIQSFIVTLGGADTSGTAELHFYGHEGGNIIPELLQDLCLPITLHKTIVGDEQIKIVLPTPINLNNNQFFIVVKNFQNGAKLASDNVVYSGFCLAGSNGGDFYWQYLQTAAGATSAKTNAFKIDVLLNYETLSAPYLSDVTTSVGIANENYSNRGLSVADFDNDGDEDLIRRNLLLRNDNGAFTDITTSAGISGNPYSSAFADMDNDGKLDIVFVMADSIFIFRNLGNQTFEKHFAAVGTYTGTQTLCVADVNNDKFPDIFIGRLWNTYPTPLPNYFYINNRNLTLADSTVSLYPNPSLNLRRTRSGTFVDFDNDGDMDLYVTNYYLERDEFYQNNGDGTFTNIIAQKGMDINSSGSNHGTGGFWADYDNDGDMDLLLPQFAHPDFVVQYDHRGTTIYRNEGAPDYNFTDLIGSPSLDDDIQFEETHGGGTFGDLNNDGLLDIYLTNFYNCRYSDVYIQKSNHKFELKTQYYLPSQRANTQEDVMFFDYNNDGHLDVLTAYVNSNVVLFKNNCTEANNYVKLSLRSTSGNSFAIGGRATVYAGGQTYTREVAHGHGANMRDPYTLHFGIGQNAQIDSVVVKWPVQPPIYEIFKNISINATHVINEGTGVVNIEDAATNSIQTLEVYPNPSKGEVTLALKTKKAESFKWELMDQIGQIIEVGFGTTQANNITNIKLNKNQQLKSGLYYYRVSTTNFSKNGKFIIAK
jgi:hypothetical protein